MIEVKFHEINSIDNAKLKYAVISSLYDGKWIFSRHCERNTWEIPGGRRETEEMIMSTARRELYEETGALDYDITPICAYSVSKDSEPESYGMLCFAEVFVLGTLPALEIAEIGLFDVTPAELTYPEIQPKLQVHVEQFLKNILWGNELWTEKITK